MVNRLRNTDTRLWWIFIGAIVLLALAFILGANLQRSNAEALPGSSRFYIVSRGDIEESVRAPGEVVVRSTNLTFQASGVITDVVVKPGSVVNAGQVLAKLDSREAEAAIAAVKADQKKAQGRLETVQTGPARELITAQQNLKVSQAKLNQISSSNAKPEELQAAQANYDAAVFRYNALVTKVTQKDKDAAEANLRKAKARLEQLRAGPGEAALREAQARVTAAVQNWEKVKLNTAEAVKQADLAVQKAQKTRDQAKDSYDTVHNAFYNSDGSPKRPLTPAEIDRDKQAKAALEQAELDLQSKVSALEAAKNRQVTNVREAEAQMIEVEAALEKLQAGAAQQDLLAAQAAVDQAQALYDKLQAGPNQDEVNASQADITKAKSLLDALNKGGTDKDIQVVQAEIEKYQKLVDTLSKGPVASELNEAQGAVDKANAQLKQAQLKVEQLSLLAPYNSVVENVFVAAGQTINPGQNGFTLVDLATMMLDARVGEASIQRIKIAQGVRVYFEGISGVRVEPFKGKVTFISALPKPGPLTAANNNPPLANGSLTPAPLALSSTPLYPVSILMDTDRDLQTLKPGMTGRVRFVLASKKDALLIPKIAMRLLEPGPVVDVMLADGQIVATPVTLGLTGDDYVEVLEDGLLREGDKIVLSNDAILPTLPAPTATTSPGGISPTPTLLAEPTLIGAPANTGPPTGQQPTGRPGSPTSNTPNPSATSPG